MQGRRSMGKDCLHRSEPSPGATVISAVTQEGEAPSEYQVQSKAYLQTNRHNSTSSTDPFTYHIEHRWETIFRIHGCTVPQPQQTW